jgi:molybdenum cofactor cytidylyltransferase
VLYVVNEGHAEGRASSIRAGLKALPPRCEAALFLPADLPLVTARDIDRVAEEYERTRAPLVVTMDSGGRRSHPVLFGRPLFPDLMALKGDRGGRDLILLHWDAAVKVVRAGPSPFDVDTPEDYQRLLETIS